eukprot:21551-Pyramimonas_sp.AAC.1
MIWQACGGRDNARDTKRRAAEPRPLRRVGTPSQRRISNGHDARKNASYPEQAGILTRGALRPGMGRPSRDRSAERASSCRHDPRNECD